MRAFSLSLSIFWLAAVTGLLMILRTGGMMAIMNPFKNLSRPQLYAVVAGGALIAGYAEYSHHKKTGSWSPFATAAVNTAAGSGIDPLTQLPYADDSVVDPETGQQYLAEAQQYGSVTAAEASVSQYGQSTATGSGIPVNPASPVAGGSVNTPVGTSIYTSDAAWSQAVQAGLSSVSGSQQYDGTDIGEALGAYLQGEPLTPGQVNVVNVAISEYGNPPVGTFQIIPAPSTPTGPTTGTAPAGPALIESLPNAGGKTWERVTFPSQAAWDQWTQWNAGFAAAHNGRTQAYRSEWNTELTALGAFGTDGPLTPPDPSSPNPYDRQ